MNTGTFKGILGIKVQVQNNDSIEKLNSTVCVQQMVSAGGAGYLFFIL